MKRVITEDRPDLLYANESAYAQRLFSHDQSIDDAVALFKIGRRQFARVLRRLPETSFARVGMHNITGLITLAELVRTYRNHADHHMRYLREKRERLLAL